MRLHGWMIAAAAVASCLAASSAAATVRASQPETLVEALRADGYGATLATDDFGDPLINLELDGWKAQLLFYDCQETTHDACQSVQFRSTFDAEGAGLSGTEALRFMNEYRFVNVTLNRSNDPVLAYDMITGLGIPGEVFLLGTKRFLEAMNQMGKQLYNR